ncbi:MAG: hypothetical protein R2856_27340 [Caldilineaceae bacterium]
MHPFDPTAFDNATNPSKLKEDGLCPHLLFTPTRRCRSTILCGSPAPTYKETLTCSLPVFKATAACARWITPASCRVQTLGYTAIDVPLSVEDAAAQCRLLGLNVGAAGPLVPADLSPDAARQEEIVNSFKTTIDSLAAQEIPVLVCLIGRRHP